MEDMIGGIRKLLKDRHAILLAHNYQRPEIQDVADLCGDSLELSRKASRTDAEVIVFCGVRFMAETAAILSPEKTLLLPAASAGCPMADMITAADVKARRKVDPDLVVLSYVNTTAEVKAESDLCCTSSNAIQVAAQIDADRKVLMTPDRNLAQYTIRSTGRAMDYWDGYCPVHDRLRAKRVREVRAAHPGAVFLAHPECRPAVLDLADAVRSTSGMLAFARESDQEEFIIGTEVGLLHPLSKENPGKTFIPVDPGMVCTDMKKTTLAEVARALEEMTPVVSVPEDIRMRAQKAVDRMLAVPGT